MADAPIPFISYSWTSEDHKQWVLELAQRLRSDGIGARLDRWHLRPGQDKYEFMESMVNDPDVTHVLLICDREYQQKADDRTRGVGTETQIISPSVYADTKSKRYVPIVVELDEHNEPCLPAYIKGRLSIVFANPGEFERRYQELVRHLYNQPEHEPPPLGSRPGWLDRRPEPAIRTAHMVQGIEHQLHQGRDTAALAMLRSYRTKFQSGCEDLLVQAVPEAGPEDEQILSLAKSLLRYRDDLVALVEVLAPHDAANANSDMRFREVYRLLCWLADFGGENADAASFFAHECFVGVVGELLMHERLARVEELLTSDYPGHRGSADFSIFSTYRRTLDGARKKRLESRMFSVEPEIIKDTTPHERFEAVVQSDLVLWARAGKERRNWLPRACLFAHWQKVPLPLFRKSCLIALGSDIRKLLRANDSTDIFGGGVLDIGIDYGRVNLTTAINYWEWNS